MADTSVTYKYYPTRPSEMTAEFVAEEYRRLIDRIASAEEAEDAGPWLELFADWNALMAFMWGEQARVNYAYARNMNDEAAEERDRYMREEVTPVVSDAESVLVNALLTSRHRGAIAERYGKYYIRRLETSVKLLDPVNRDLRTEASSLSKKYAKLVAGAEVEMRGERMTLNMAGSFMIDDDREIRREAFMVVRGWFIEHRDEIAAIYDELVRVRTEMARNVGFDSYVPFGYLAMGRTDYGPEESARFRENVRTYAVPLLKELRERQRRELDVETLRPWDNAYDPSLTLPRGIAPVASQLDRAQRIFESLSPRLAGHFVKMRREGLIDLENRRGKQAGAFCTNFPDEGRPAILCNSTGDADDVRTLLHEMGHAFQKWESEPIEVVSLQFPTADAAEIHSMGMEYLSMRHIDEFFGEEETVKFRRGRWKKAVALLCYVAIVDEFQHWVYEHPEATADDRDREWSRIWDIYEAGVDYDGLEEYKSARWYAQGHIFASPFYYIDYAIAETAAMQLALIDAEDHERAMETYLELCRLGGTRSVLEIIGSAGLRSPFDAETMKDLMEHAEKELGGGADGSGRGA